ncbi:hypothetical protein BGZ94_005588, partial [Podila epigama]
NPDLLARLKECLDIGAAEASFEKVRAKGHSDLCRIVLWSTRLLDENETFNMTMQPFDEALSDM